MKMFFLRFFTWWNGATFGTLLHTKRKGTRIGEDEFGNMYYTGGVDSEGRTRRWVIYSGEAEASRVPPGWNGWLHHSVELSPAEEEYQPHGWELKHQHNLTGTGGAYRPKGSMASQDKRPAVTGDYDAWSPSE